MNMAVNSGYNRRAASAQHYRTTQAGYVASITLLCRKLS
jgi:hypothetical protein